MDDVDGKPFCFEVYSDTASVVKGCKTDSRGTVVQGNHRAYRMSAASAEDRLEWLEALRDSIREHPFHEVIAAKKAALVRRSQQQALAQGGLVAPFQPATPSAKV